MAAEKAAEKPADPPAGAFNLDGILAELGSFGKYQLLLLLLLAFRDSFLAMCNFHYVFTAADVAHRCHIPECEAPGAGYADTTPWGSFALPNDTHCCLRQAPAPSPPRNLTTPPAPHPRCRPEDFQDEEVPCDRLVYQNNNSMVAEFDLGCSPWKRTLVGTVHNLGLLVSFVVSGFISDRYGRKVIIVGSPLTVGVAGLLKSFAPSYWSLLLLEFLETALGYGNASLVLSLESVNQSSRVTFSCISDILSSLGSSLLGVIAWKVPYWRHLVRAIYAPLLVVVFYIFLVDEGVRWLLAHNKKGEAVRVLHKVARVNKVTLSSAARAMLRQLEDDISRTDQNNKEPQKTISAVMMNDLRNKTILGRVALFGCCFFCCAFVFTAATVNSTGVSGDPHLNLAAMSLVSVPVRVLSAVTLARFGRTAPIAVAYSLCAVFSVLSAFVPRSYGWASLLLYLAAKMGNSYGYFAVYLVAMELFPTTSRNSLLNIATTFGRVGSVLAPQTPLLERYMRGLPSVVLGVVALGPAALALLLPDTSRAALPEDARAAERLNRPAPPAPAPAPPAPAPPAPAPAPPAETV